MSQNYTYVLLREALEQFAKQKKRNQKLILRRLNLLLENPYAEPDLQLQDSDGYECFIIIEGPLAINYYLDHPVKRVVIAYIEVV